LKIVDFEPEFAGKKSFYQAAVDNLIKTPQDAATIGIILCRGKNKTVVEYTLRDAKSPMGGVAPPEFHPSPDEKFSFLIARGEDQQTIDLIDKKTEKILQRIADDDMSSVSYKVLWAPDSKRFALMTRAGHSNQDVTVYFLKGDKFQEIKIPDLTVEIPARIRAGKDHPHVAANNWQQAQKWNKDGSLLLTIDNTIDGAGHTAGATRTVVLGFDKSGKPKILKSTVKYESSNDED
jgi:YhcG PDDEXK nuclease domain